MCSSSMVLLLMLTHLLHSEGPKLKALPNKYIHSTCVQGGLHKDVHQFCRPKILDLPQQRMDACTLWEWPSFSKTLTGHERGSLQQFVQVCSSDLWRQEADNTVIDPQWPRKLVPELTASALTYGDPFIFSSRSILSRLLQKSMRIRWYVTFTLLCCKWMQNLQKKVLHSCLAPVHTVTSSQCFKHAQLLTGLTSQISCSLL